MTSLLAAESYPAVELACAYHKRWEVEITLDEIGTHQRLCQYPLRSHKRVGVL